MFTKISNSDKVTLSFTSDQSDVSTKVFVNGLLLKVRWKAYGVEIPVDGNFNVEFVTLNNNGDTSKEAVNYTIDKTARYY